MGQPPEGGRRSRSVGVGDKPWTIRDMDPDARMSALDAARRAGVTVPIWLAQAIRGQVAAEHGERYPFSPHGGVVQAGDQPGQALTVIEQPPSPPRPGGPTIDDIARIVELAERLAERHHRPVPKRFLARVAGVLYRRLSDTPSGV
jgi:hypothetical protein